MASKTSTGGRSPDVSAILARAPVFGDIPEETRARLIAESREVVLDAGQSLWRAGEPALNIGVALVGRCKIVRGEDAREVIVDVAVPGDVLGEVAFSIRATYQSSVVCLRRARVLLVPADAFRRALAQSPDAAQALALDLAAQVVRLMRAIEDLSAGSVERRLARVLLRLAERAGEPFPGGTLIPLRLRRADLAAIAATTLESASRKIADWQRRGWVVPQPAGYLVRNEAALRKVAHDE